MHTGKNGRVGWFLVLVVFAFWSSEDARGQDAPRGGENPFAWLSERGERPERESEPERDEIETDRDSFTPAPSTVGRGRLIFEAAYSFIDNRGFYETHSFPEVLFRYGLTDWLELRCGTNYEVGGAGEEIAGSGDEVEFSDQGRRRKLVRESQVGYGVKIRLSEAQGWVPESSVLLQGLTPTSGPGTDTQFVGGCVFGWELPNQWKLHAAARYTTDSEGPDRFGIWSPSVVVKVPLSEKLNAHAEYFALFSRDKAQEFNRQFFSPGVHYLITPDFEVGVRLGWGLNDQTARFFANAGVGVRF
jgi:hypothetical protein